MLLLAGPRRFHYFTDTVAGVAVGTGTVCGLALILDVGAARLGGRQAENFS